MTKIHRHHLLEIILWPNQDGSFTEIRNTRSRLKELGIYNDYKMTIEVSNTEHASLHHKGITLTDEHVSNIRKNHSHFWKDKPGTFKGKKHSEESKQKMSKSLKGRDAWNKGKELSESQKQKMSLNSAARKNAILFREYKNNGGTLKWNEWQKTLKR